MAEAEQQGDGGTAAEADAGSGGAAGEDGIGATVPVFSGSTGSTSVAVVSSKIPRRPASVSTVIYEPDFAMVKIGEEDCTVDLTACAPQAAFFAAIRERRRKASAGEGSPASASGVDVQLPDFPGGIEVLRDVVRYLQVTAAEERAAAAAAGDLGVPAGVLKVDPGAFHLELDTENIGSYLEAAAVLKCPRLLRDTVLNPAAKDLSSRRVLSLLERVILFTAEASTSTEASLAMMADDDYPKEQPLADDEDGIVQPSQGNADGCSQEQVVQGFSQVIQRLCARLDAVDFRLTAALAAGAPWASLEVLRAFRVKFENVGRMNYALQSVTSTVKSLFAYEQEKGTQQLQQDWKEHHFALHVFRKHIIEATLFSQSGTLRASPDLAMLEQENEVRWSDDEAEEGSMNKEGQNPDDDIPEAICDAAQDKTLAGLAGFVMYCDPLQTPPVLAATMIRSLLLVLQVPRAKKLFEGVFVRSRKAQAMVVTGHIPIDFLSSVKHHRAASVVLRRLLAQYGSTDPPELSHLLGTVLLEEFADEKHCQSIILVSTLVRDIVIYCRVTTRGAAEAAAGGAQDGATVSGTSGDVELLRLRMVGERLFAATFVTHGGFLPQSLSSSLGGLGGPQAPEEAAPGEPECPWDSGELDLPLLQHVPQSEDALHLARRVLLRGLFRRHAAGVENDVPQLAALWALGKWPTCRDVSLIAEAFKFLCQSWRKLMSSKLETSPSQGAARDSDTLSDEEQLFTMFSDLEFWRLHPGDLLTPWAPPQLLGCHIAARCKLLDEQQVTLFEENRRNLEEINRLRQTVMQLTQKLEVVDARSMHSLQKQADIADTLRTLR